MNPSLKTIYFLFLQAYTFCPYFLITLYEVVKLSDFQKRKKITEAINLSLLLLGNLGLQAERKRKQ